jgi:prepilin signal peptidase PulO-like enzyme (type II secretory pathway)
LRAGGGILTGVMVLSIMYLLGKIIYKKDSVGFGDFKLSAVTGVFTGPLWNLMIMLIAIIAGGFWGIYLLATGKKKPEQEIPFGPFIAIGAFAVIFFKKFILLIIEKYLALM